MTSEGATTSAATDSSAWTEGVETEIVAEVTPQPEEVEAAEVGVTGVATDASTEATPQPEALSDMTGEGATTSAATDSSAWTEGVETEIVAEVTPQPEEVEAAEVGVTGVATDASTEATPQPEALSDMTSEGATTSAATDSSAWTEGVETEIVAEVTPQPEEVEAAEVGVTGVATDASTEATPQPEALSDMTSEGATTSAATDSSAWTEGVETEIVAEVTPQPEEVEAAEVGVTGVATDASTEATPQPEALSDMTSEGATTSAATDSSAWTEGVETEIVAEVTPQPEEVEAAEVGVTGVATDASTEATPQPEALSDMTSEGATTSAATDSSAWTEGVETEIVAEVTPQPEEVEAAEVGVTGVATDASTEATPQPEALSDMTGEGATTSAATDSSAWTEGVETEIVAEVTPQPEEVEAAEVGVTGVATDASTEATPQPEALSDMTSEGATTSAATDSSAWTEGVETEIVAEVTPQPEEVEAAEVGVTGVATDASTEATPQPEALSDMTSEGATTSAATDSSAWTEGVETEIVAEVTPQPEEVEAAEVGVTGVATDASTEATPQPEALSDMTSEGATTSAATDSSAWTEGVETEIVAEVTPQPEEVEAAEVGVTGVATDASTEATPQPEALSDMTGEGATTSAATDSSAWTEGVETEIVAEVTPQPEEVEAAEVGVTGVATDASTEATPQPEALSDMTSEGATTSAATDSSAWTEGVETEIVAEVTPQPEEVEAAEVGVTGVATDASTEATPQPEALSDMTSEGATTSAATDSSAWTEGVETEIVAEVTPQPEEVEAAEVGVTGVATDASTEATPQPEALSDMTSEGATTSAATDSSAWTEGVETEIVAEVTPQPEEVEAAEVGVTGVATDASTEATPQPEALSDMTSEGATTSAATDSSAWTEGVETEIVAEVTPQPEEVEAAEVGVTGVATDASTEATPQPEALSDMTGEGATTSAATDSSAWTEGVETEIVAEVTPQPEEVEAAEVGVTGVATDASTEATPQPEALSDMTSEGATTSAATDSSAWTEGVETEIVAEVTPQPEEVEAAEVGVTGVATDASTEATPQPEALSDMTSEGATTSAATDSSAWTEGVETEIVAEVTPQPEEVEAAEVGVTGVATDASTEATPQPEALSDMTSEGATTSAATDSSAWTEGVETEIVAEVTPQPEEVEAAEVGVTGVATDASTEATPQPEALSDMTSEGATTSAATDSSAWTEGVETEIVAEVTPQPEEVEAAEVGVTGVATDASTEATPQPEALSDMTSEGATTSAATDSSAWTEGVETEIVAEVTPQPEEVEAAEVGVTGVATDASTEATPQPEALSDMTSEGATTSAATDSSAWTEGVETEIVAEVTPQPEEVEAAEVGVTGVATDASTEATPQPEALSDMTSEGATTSAATDSSAWTEGVETEIVAEVTPQPEEVEAAEVGVTGVATDASTEATPQPEALSDMTSEGATTSAATDSSAWTEGVETEIVAEVTPQPEEVEAAEVGVTGVATDASTEATPQPEALSDMTSEGATTSAATDSSAWTEGVETEIVAEVTPQPEEVEAAEVGVTGVATDASTEATPQPEALSDMTSEGATTSAATDSSAWTEGVETEIVAEVTPQPEEVEAAEVGVTGVATDASTEATPQPEALSDMTSEGATTSAATDSSAWTEGVETEIVAEVTPQPEEVEAAEVGVTGVATDASTEATPQPEALSDMTSEGATTSAATDSSAWTEGVETEIVAEVTPQPEEVEAAEVGVTGVATDASTEATPQPEALSDMTSEGATTSAATDSSAWTEGVETEIVAEVTPQPEEVEAAEVGVTGVATDASTEATPQPEALSDMTSEGATTSAATDSSAWTEGVETEIVAEVTPQREEVEAAEVGVTGVATDASTEATPQPEALSDMTSEGATTSAATDSSAWTEGVETEIVAEVTPQPEEVEAAEVGVTGVATDASTEATPQPEALSDMTSEGATTSAATDSSAWTEGVETEIVAEVTPQPEEVEAAEVGVTGVATDASTEATPQPEALSDMTSEGATTSAATDSSAWTEGVETEIVAEVTPQPEEVEAAEVGVTGVATDASTEATPQPEALSDMTSEGATTSAATDSSAWTEGVETEIVAEVTPQPEEVEAAEVGVTGVATDASTEATPQPEALSDMTSEGATTSAATDSSAWTEGVETEIVAEVTPQPEEVEAAEVGVTGVATDASTEATPQPEALSDMTSEGATTSAATDSSAWTEGVETEIVAEVTPQPEEVEAAEVGVTGVATDASTEATPQPEALSDMTSEGATTSAATDSSAWTEGVETEIVAEVTPQPEEVEAAEVGVTGVATDASTEATPQPEALSDMTSEGATTSAATDSSAWTEGVETEIVAEVTPQPEEVEAAEVGVTGVATDASTEATPQPEALSDMTSEGATTSAATDSSAWTEGVETEIVAEVTPQPEEVEAAEVGVTGVATDASTEATPQPEALSDMTSEGATTSAATDSSAWTEGVETEIVAEVTPQPEEVEAAEVGVTGVATDASTEATPQPEALSDMTSEGATTSAATDSSAWTEGVETEIVAEVTPQREEVEAAEVGVTGVATDASTEATPQPEALSDMTSEGATTSAATDSSAWTEGVETEIVAEVTPQPEEVEAAEVGVTGVATDASTEATPQPEALSDMTSEGATTSAATDSSAWTEGVETEIVAEVTPQPEEVEAAEVGVTGVATDASTEATPQPEALSDMTSEGATTSAATDSSAWTEGVETEIVAEVTPQPEEVEAAEVGVTGVATDASTEATPQPEALSDMTSEGATTSAATDSSAWTEGVETEIVAEVTPQPEEVEAAEVGVTGVATDASTEATPQPEALSDMTSEGATTSAATDSSAWTEGVETEIVAEVTPQPEEVEAAEVGVTGVATDASTEATPQPEALSDMTSEGATTSAATDSSAWTEGVETEIVAEVTPQPEEVEAAEVGVTGVATDASTEATPQPEALSDMTSEGATTSAATDSSAWTEGVETEIVAEVTPQPEEVEAAEVGVTGVATDASTEATPQPEALSDMTSEGATTSAATDSSAWTEGVETEIVAEVTPQPEEVEAAEVGVTGVATDASTEATPQPEALSDMTSEGATTSAATDSSAWTEGVETEIVAEVTPQREEVEAAEVGVTGVATDASTEATPQPEALSDMTSEGATTSAATDSSAWTEGVETEIVAEVTPQPEEVEAAEVGVTGVATDASTEATPQPEALSDMTSEGATTSAATDSSAWTEGVETEIVAEVTPQPEEVEAAEVGVTGVATDASTEATPQPEALSDMTSEGATTSAATDSSAWTEGVETEIVAEVTPQPEEVEAAEVGVTGVATDASTEATPQPEALSDMTSEGATTSAATDSSAWTEGVETEIVAEVTPQPEEVEAAEVGVTGVATDASTEATPQPEALSDMTSEGATTSAATDSSAWTEGVETEIVAEVTPQREEVEAAEVGVTGVATDASTEATPQPEALSDMTSEGATTSAATDSSAWTEGVETEIVAEVTPQPEEVEAAEVGVTGVATDASTEATPQPEALSDMTSEGATTSAATDSSAWTEGVETEIVAEVTPQPEEVEAAEVGVTGVATDASTEATPQPEALSDMTSEGATTSAATDSSAWTEGVETEIVAEVTPQPEEVEAAEVGVTGVATDASTEATPQPEALSDMTSEGATTSAATDSSAWTEGVETEIVAEVTPQPEEVEAAEVGVTGVATDASTEATPQPEALSDMTSEGATTSAATDSSAWTEGVETEIVAEVTPQPEEVEAAEVGVTGVATDASTEATPQPEALSDMTSEGATTSAATDSSAWTEGVETEIVAEVTPQPEEVEAAEVGVTGVATDASTEVTSDLEAFSFIGGGNVSISLPLSSLNTFENDSGYGRIGSSSLVSSPAPVSSCSPSVALFCELLSRAIGALGVQVNSADEVDYLTTTTSEPVAVYTTLPPASPLSEMESSPSSTTAVPLSTTVVEFTTAMTEKPDFSHLVPMVDLSDMSVRVLDTKGNHLVPGARLENGRLHFENGTVISIQDISGFLPPEDAMSNVIVSVNLPRGTTTLLDLETSEPIMSQRSSDGIPLETIRNYGAGANFEILVDNAIIQVDPYQGEWTVQDAETGGINLVQEVKNGVLYLANGEQVKLPTAESEDLVLAIDAVTGVVRTVNKETGECFASIQSDIPVTIPMEEEQVLGTEKMKEELTSSLPLKEGKTTSTDALTSPSEEEERSSTVTSSPTSEEEKVLWTLPSLPTLENEEVSLPGTLSPPSREREELMIATSPLPLPEKVKGSLMMTSPTPLMEEEGPSTATFPSPSEEEGGLSTVTLPSILEEEKTPTLMEEEGSSITLTSLPSTDVVALSTDERDIEGVEHPFEHSSSVDEVTSSSFSNKEEEIKGTQKTTEISRESWVTGDGTEEAELPLEGEKSTPDSEADEAATTPSASKEEEIPTTKAPEKEDMEINTETTIRSKNDLASCDSEVCRDEGSPTLVFTEPPSGTEESKGKDPFAHVDEERDDFRVETESVNKDVMTMTTVEEKMHSSKDKADEITEGEDTTLDSSSPEGYTTTTPSLNEYYKSPDPLYQEEYKTMPPEEDFKALESENFLEEETSTTPAEREPRHDALIEIPPFQGLEGGEGAKDSIEKGVDFSDSKTQGQDEQMHLVTPDEVGGKTTYITSSLETSTESPALVEDQKSKESTKDQSAQEILQPDCQCLERLLTPELLDRLRNNELDQSQPGDKVYEELFKTPSFLRVVKEVITEYFDQPGVVERYKSNCLCPANNDCKCPAPVTTPKPPYNISSSSQHILGALKDMSNGAIIMNNESVLAKVAYSLAPGSMVYLSAEDSFFLKTDEKKNIWRKIDMNTQSESVRIPEPQSTTTTTSIPVLAENLVGKSLMLVAHNEPLNGELRFGAKITGGHSNAIFACQRAARRHNISHIFYPLMSTDMFNMDYVVPPMYRYDMPIVNRNGKILFNDFMHLIKGEQPAMAPIYTFAGKEVDSDPTIPCAWIGAKPIYLNGDYAYAARSKCRNWQTHSPMESGLAVHIPMNANATGFLDQSNLYEESCARRCSVLCIQISPN
ncbi:Collagen alpha-1 XV chain [Taenia crassiceps]|uniref:Collagen alpha-1 XV chain n=1 Tax=Taenia crassiceps TaxID=6207 RepID=A0ABR4QL91_9CEST